MLKLVFTHAEVRDSGFGLEVNGKSLEDIISEALGTKAEGLNYNDPKLKKFSSNSCDITVMICPHDKETLIKTDKEVFHSLKELEDDRRERFAEETGEAESES